VADLYDRIEGTDILFANVTVQAEMYFDHRKGGLRRGIEGTVGLNSAFHVVSVENSKRSYSVF